MTTVIACNNSTAQIFQLRLLLESFKEHGFKYPVHILVFVMEKETREVEWRQLNGYNCKIYFYKADAQVMQDLRVYTNIHRLYSLIKHADILGDGPILYLDSDILLLKPLDLDKYLEDSVCYGSDINSYSNHTYYFKTKQGVVRPELVEAYKEANPVADMLLTCGLEPKVMEKYDKQTAGVHYLLKGFNKESWKRVYKNTLYITQQLDLINQSFFMGNSYQERDNKGFQKYCADILATHIEIWSQGRDTQILPELNFIWPGDPKEKLSDYHWFHNAGVGPNDGLFWKGKYVHTKIMPYHQVENQYIDNLYNTIQDKAQHHYITKIIGLRNA